MPFYLRKTEGGKVKNRRVCKRDATLLIKDVWREKDIFDSTQVRVAILSFGRLISNYIIRFFCLHRLSDCPLAKVQIICDCLCISYLAVWLLDKWMNLALISVDCQKL